MTYEITVVSLEEQPTAVGRASVALPELSSKLAEILPSVANHLMSVGKPPVGFPFTRYLKMSESVLEIEAGMPVSDVIQDSGPIFGSTLPAGKVLKTIHQGPYDRLSEAHLALENEMKAKDLIASGDVWEVYVTDPGEVQDPMEWKTEVFAAIKEGNKPC